MSEEAPAVPVAPAPPPPEVPAPAPAPEAPAAAATPDPIADAPATTAPDPIADAPPSEPAPAPEPAPVVEAAPEPEAWTGENWAGLIDEIPENHREVARIVSDFYDKQLREQRMITRALESVIDETGSDPRLKQALADIEKHAGEMEAKQAELAKVMEQLAGLEQQVAGFDAQREEIHSSYEKAAMDQFLHRHPDLKDPETKLYKRVNEILEDEGEADLWELWELPDLAELGKKEFAEVRKLRADGVPTRYAMDLVKAKGTPKEDSFPVDALSGTSAPGARPALRKMSRNGTFQDTLSAVAESSLLRHRQNLKKRR
jgi:hypothetical protein